MTGHRRLPHIQPEGRDLFITWHLHGSLPSSRYPPRDHENAGKAFVWMDRYLDTTTAGPLHLKQPEIANLVEQAILHGDHALKRYETIAYVIMANHVHLLATPKSAPSQFMRTLKGYTAREANKILGRTGHPFWQSESYDHWVRNDKERQRIRRYVENNPVTAGVVEHPEDYRWSSAYQKEPRRLSAQQA